MNLILDLGNTALKWAIFNGKNLIVKGKFVYDDLEKSSEVWLNYDIKKVAIASVIEIPDFIKTLLKRFNYVLKIDQTTKIPIRNSYKTPETLGVDRLVNAVAALSLSTNGSALIIDCGTCLKIDLVTKLDGFVGGSIAPGLKMRYSSLANYTSKLPLIGPNQFEYLTGTSTNDSIHNGIVNGMYYEISGAIENYQKSFPNIHIIITGGDLSYFQKITEKKTIFAEPDLTIVGINLILLHNIE